MKNILKLAFACVISLIFFSCTKNDNTEEQVAYFPEITNNTIGAAIAGGTIQINGNFEKNKEYIITFPTNQIGKIIEVTEKYLKVEVPQNAVSGEVKLTFNGQTKVVATIEIQKEYELYSFRRSHENGNIYRKEIIKIDLNTGNQSVIASLDIESPYFTDLAFDQKENNIIGLTDDSNGTILVKVNLETGKSTKIMLSDTGVSFNSLVKDNKGGFYAYRRNYKDANNYIKELVWIDTETGNQSVIAKLDIESPYFTDLVFDQKENNIIGLTDDSNGTILVKVNLETGKSTKIMLSDTGVSFNSLVEDNKGNFYAYRRNYKEANNYIKELVWIDTETGNQSVIASLDIETPYFTDLVFDQKENNIIGLTDDSNGTILVKVNLETGKSTKTRLSSETKTNFNDLLFVGK